MIWSACCPIFVATPIVPTFEENARMPGRVMLVPQLNGWVSRNVVPPLFTVPQMETVESALITPLCSPAPSVTTLWIEPGSTTVCVQLSTFCGVLAPTGLAALYVG